MAELNFQAKEIQDLLDGVLGDSTFRLKITSDEGETKWLRVSEDQVRGIRYMLTDFPEGDE